MADMARWTDESSKNFWKTAAGNLGKSFRNTLLGESNTMDPYPAAGGITAATPAQSMPSQAAPVSGGLRSAAAATPPPAEPVNLPEVPGKVAVNPNAPVAPLGKYGWKGSVGTNGQPTLTLGTPGQDGAGFGSVRPGSAIASGLRSSKSASPYTVTGDPAAVAAFSGPVSGGAAAALSRQRQLNANPVVQPEYFSDNRQTVDNSLGGMFERGLRMKQAKTETGIRNADMRTMLEQRGQDVAMRGQDIGFRTGVERNQIDLERLKLSAPGERAQAEAAQMQVEKERRVGGLYDAYLKETDPTAKAALREQFNLLTGRQEKAPSIHYGVEGFDNQPYAVVPDASAPTGLRKITNAQMSGGSDVRSALNPRELEAFNKLSPEKQKAAEAQILARMSGQAGIR